MHEGLHFTADAHTGSDTIIQDGGQEVYWRSSRGSNWLPPANQNQVFTQTSVRAPPLPVLLMDLIDQTVVCSDEDRLNIDPV